MEEARARELLQAERQRLERIRDERGEMASDINPERAPEAAEGDLRGGDSATNVFDREIDASVLEDLDRQLGEIDAAFQRLDDGTYGICEETGEQIPDERLEERPATRFTVEGQRIVEKRDTPEQYEGADPTI